MPGSRASPRRARPSASVSALVTRVGSAQQLHRHARGRPSCGSVEHVRRDGDAHARNFRAWERWACAISDSSARTSTPPRTTSSPPTTTSSGRCGPASTIPATGSSAPASSSPSTRHTAKSAHLPASSEPMSSLPQHRCTASRAEPDRVARRHRGTASPAARDEQRLLHLEEEVAALVRSRAVDAETDAHAGVEHVADRRHAGAEPQVRRRAVGDAGAGLANCAMSRSERCTQCAHQTSSASHPRRSRYSTGRQP